MHPVIPSFLEEALMELMMNDPDVVLLESIDSSDRPSPLLRNFPDRFFHFDPLSHDIIATAAGMSKLSKKPIICAPAAALTGEFYAQIRNALSYATVPVKLIGLEAGLRGQGMVSHQALDDLALMRLLPGMTVFSPADHAETKAMLRPLVDCEGPAYLRLSNHELPVLFDTLEGHSFPKATVLRPGSSVTLLATGSLVFGCLAAATQLSEHNLHAEVINVSTIQPLDRDTILASAAKTRLVITAEDHFAVGGLGSAVAELLAEHLPTRLHRIGLTDFGATGEAIDLYEKYGFDTQGLYSKIKKLLAMSYEL